MSPENGQRHVVIVGGGFAGVGCARRLPAATTCASR
jgi:cation diffusion facilitator CzcD-associated flavoprotein CzcO